MEGGDFVLSSIDTRVVEAKFDNKQFQEGVKQTLSSLSEFNKGLQLNGATKGLDEVNQATGRVTSGIHVMRIAATTAIATMSYQATRFAENLVKSFTFDPIKAGFENYETQINAIQTILANTGLKGKEGLSQVNSVLKELNTYANQTVYNFSEMARNIGTFTAAGVKLKPAAESIKGIANLAALSGSTSQQASTAMYQLSQAIAAGQVKLQDWNSVVNAGMGGKVFQSALFNTAKAMGTLKKVKLNETFDQWTKAGNSFRGSLQDGWITGKVLTQTLQNFTGDMTAAQLKSIGYNKEQIKTILEQGKTAVDAATKIKTLTQLTDALKEEVATAYSAIFKTIFGNITQAKTLFSAVHTSVENALTKPIYAVNKVLIGWSKLGGRNALIDAIKNGLHDIAAIIKPIKDAFREIFPPATAKSLYEMTVSLRDFLANLKIGAQTADNLKRTFAGVFAVLDIGWQVIKAGIKFIADLFGAITKGEGSGGFLGATAHIGDFLVALDQAIKKGQGLTRFFQGLEHILAGPIALIKAVTGAVLGLFSGFSAPSTDKIVKAFDPLATLGRLINDVWSEIGNILKAVWHVFEPIAQKFADFFSGLGQAITNALGGINYEDVLHTINTGLFAGLVLLLKKFVDHFRGGGNNPIKGFLDTIKEPFEQLTGTLQTMQNTLRATTLLQIAAAIGIMAASVIGLSKVNPTALSNALGAMTAMFIQLFGALAVFNKIGGAEGLTATSTGLILFATAIRVLTSSVVKLSTLDWEGLAKGLVGVTGLIIGLTAAARGLSGQGAGMVRAGAGLLILSAAIRILVGAVTDLSNLSWGQMSKGLTGVAALLTALALYSKFGSANSAGILSGAGIVLLAAGIKILASALKDISDLSWNEIAKGLTGVAGGLVVISAALNLIPKSSVISAGGVLIIAGALNLVARAMAEMGKQSWGQIAKGLVSLAGALGVIATVMSLMEGSLPGAAAILIVASSLGMIAKAMGEMGGMSWSEIGKSLTELASGLGIIAAAMYVMTGTLAGAAATLVVAAALRVLTPVLTTLGGMSWGSIVKGLVTLAGAFTIIGVAGLVLTPLVPALLGLGASIALIGAGTALAGVGVLAFATGLTSLAVSLPAVAAGIVALVTAVVGLLPVIVKQLGIFLVAIGEGVAKAAPALEKGIIALIHLLVVAVKDQGPQLVDAFSVLLVHMLAKMADAIPKMSRSALKMILGILDTIKEKTPDIVDSVANLIVRMLNSMTRRVGDFVDAATKLIVAFLGGIAKNVPKVAKAGADIIIAWINAIADQSVRIVNAAFDAVIKFINGVADAIEKHTPELRDAGKHLAFAIADGMTLGLASKVKSVTSGAEGLAKSALGGAKKILGIFSPSKEFRKLGEYCADGFAIGLIGGKDQVNQGLSTFRDAVKSVIQSTKSDVDQYKSDLKSLHSDHATLVKDIRDETYAVAEAQKKLSDLQNGRKQDHEAIVQAQHDLQDKKDKLDTDTKALKDNEEQQKKTTKALAEAHAEHDASKAAYDEFEKGLQKQKQSLRELGTQYDEYTAKIDGARQALQDAINTRDQYNQQVTDQFSQLPDISQDTDVATYIESLQQKVSDTQAFIDALGKLRAMGLNDDTYKELLSKGVDALPFVQNLVEGGQEAIDTINALTTQLDTEAKGLGDTASKSLYQAGVNAAQGLLNGLIAKRKDIKQQMEDIAAEMEKAIKKKLKIKSPSEVMSEIGVYAMQGLGAGFAAAEPDFQQILHGIGRRMVATIQKYVDNAIALINSVDTSSIAPVVDQSKQKDTKINTPKVSTSTTSSTATSASIGFGNLTNLKLAVEGVSKTTNLTLIQNNTSPKALSSADIYRQTNNQLSKAKGALADAS